MGNAARTILLITTVLCLAGCASTRKLENIRNRTLSAGLAMPDVKDEPIDTFLRKATRDTLKITDDEGHEMLLMKTVRDEETGEMVATEELDAVVITATFRNVAERGGKVMLDFKITVPSIMMDNKWQIRLHPRLVVLDDTTSIEDVILTGSEYRKQQLKGYQQYDRFVSRIITDSTKFIDLNNLETFIRRNIPELYAFKTDSSYVSDEQFISVFGVDSREAIEHYTDGTAIRLNELRKSRKTKMFLKYVRNPITTEHIRLDTVISNQSSDFTYQYNYVLTTRPKLRKAEVFLVGEILDSERKLYSIPPSDTVTYYISSISMFADQSEHFKTKIIERKVESNLTCNLSYKVGKCDIDMNLGSNSLEIRRIKDRISGLLENVEFDLDSIIVVSSASPDGKFSTNTALSLKRSISISSFISTYAEARIDSLEKNASFIVDSSGRMTAADNIRKDIRFTSRSKGENWDLLTELIDRDTVIDRTFKKDYSKLLSIENPDNREHSLKRKPYYTYVRDNLFPLLRSSSIEFHMHRKGMVKDTIHTTILDTLYMNGVQALKDMDYEKALQFLQPYQDYNTAIAYVGLGRNHSALEILEKSQENPQTDYLMSILYSRVGKIEEAVSRYISACRKNSFYIHRGNLDPEISSLIKTYNLNSDVF